MNNFTHYIDNRIVTKQASEKFFTKKRIIFITIFSVIFIVAIFLAFWGLKINLSDILNLFLNSFNKNHIALFFVFLVFIFPLTRLLYIFSYIRPVMIYNNIHLSALEYISLFCKVVVINAITPFASGSEPYTVYWLTSRGLDINYASMVSICNGIYQGVTEIIITIPSFILISLKYYEISQINIGLVIYWFIFGGLMVNFLVLGVFLISAFSARTQYYISVFFNFILRKLKMHYLTKDEICNKYLVNKTFRCSLIKMMSNPKYVFTICITYAFYTIYYYFTFYFSLEALNIDQINFSHSIGNLFNIINVALTANNFIPIPGAEGTIQITLITLTSIFDQSINIEPTYINNVVGFWRIMTTYIPLIICLILAITYYCLKLYLINYRKKNMLTKIQQLHLICEPTIVTKYE